MTASKFVVKIEVLVDYDPKFLPSLMNDLAHKFDVPNKNITITCAQHTDYGEIFKFLKNARMDIFK